MQSHYKSLHPLSKLGIVTLIALLSLILSMIIASVLAIPIFGADSFSKLMSSSLGFDESNLNLLKYMQIVQSVGLFIIPSIILSYLFGEKIVAYLVLNKKPLIISAVLATIIIFVASPLINLIGVWNSNMVLPDWLEGIEEWMKATEETAEIVTKLFVQADSIGGLLFNIFMIALIPAIGEELLFRGIIQKIFTEWSKNNHVAIWITAILFSALHMQFYGFVPRAILGAMFGYLLIWSGNLWLPIIAHFINNATAVIAYYLHENGIINIDPDEIGTNSEYGIAAIISLIVIVILFRTYYKYELQKRLQQ